MPASRPLSLGAAGPRRKRGFAKRVPGFAKRVRRVRPVPGFPMLWIAGAAVALLMIVTGGFRTGALPLDRRIPFWLMLMGWNTLKWQLWFALTVRTPRDWMWSSAASALLLALPIPFEIDAISRLLGLGSVAPALFEVWGRALTIGAGVFAACTLAFRILNRRRAAAPAAPAGGLLDRARIDPAALAAIEAEDHYCRVHARDGASALIHYRFGDALREVEGLGAQVHRGAWVATDAIERAERDGRRWRLLLEGGASVRVSSTYAAEARARGWLRR